jgi:hypothetical protein
MTFSWAQAPEKEETFLGEYPALEQLTYKEPASGIYFGIGVSPFVIVGSKFGAGLSAFQFHYMNNWLDWEVLNGGFQFAFGSNASARSNFFNLRSAPKWRISKMLSVGPLVGYEVVSFSNVSVTLQHGGKETPVEPFSSRGFTYGVAACENFTLANGSVLKIGQIFYQETYPTKKTSDGWAYDYKTTDGDKAVKANYVLALEASYLF